jgi:hypothetical protein
LGNITNWKTFGCVCWRSEGEKEEERRKKEEGRRKKEEGRMLIQQAF